MNYSIRGTANILGVHKKFMVYKGVHSKGQCWVSVGSVLVSVGSVLGQPWAIVCGFDSHLLQHSFFGAWA